MKILKPDSLALLYATNPTSQGENADCELVIACVAYFDFEQSVGALLDESRLWDDAAKCMPADAPLDEGFVKPRAEYLVYGSCFPEKGATGTRARDVLVRVGGLQKHLTVYGERFWRGDKHSDPAPFSRIPMTWENAFGGGEEDENPVGKGRAEVEDGLMPLPNIQRHGEYIASPKDSPRPVGLGAVLAAWPPRRALAGKYTRQWMENRFPARPADLAPEYFMCAQEDQRFAGPLTGAEDFAIQGMHPEKSTVSGALPAIRCRVFVQRKQNGAAHFQELETQADTVTLFPEKERAAMTFRAVTLTMDEECADIDALLTVFEPLAEPEQPVEHYQSLVNDALNPPPPPAPPASEPQAPAPEKSAAAAPQLQAPAAKAAPLAMAELQETVAKVEAEAQLMLEKSGVSREEAEAFLANIEQETAAESVQVSEGEAADSLQPLINIGDNIEKQAKEILQQSGTTEEDIEAFLAKTETTKDASDFETLFAEQLADPAVSEEMKAGLRDMIKGAAGVVAACSALSALGDKMGGEIKKAMHREASPPPEDPAPPPPPQRLTVKDVLERHARGQSLSNTDLRDLDLSKQDLRGADFQGAMLQGAMFKQCNLADALFTGADCSDVDFSQSDMEGANLSGALLENAKLLRIKGISLQAKEARFYGVDASESDFTGADLEDADFSGAVLNNANFRAAKAPRLRLYGAELKHADFTDATMINSRADEGTDAQDANFRAANMEFAGWRKARLSGVDLCGARLANANMSGCTMHGACLERVDGRDANFYKADLKSANMFEIELLRASLRRARLSGANLASANLKNADLLHCKVRSTSMRGANLENTVLDPELLSGFGE